MRDLTARFVVGDIVRGPYGRRYKVLECIAARQSYTVRRVTRGGNIDMRCGVYTFPGGYLSPLEDKSDA